MLAKNRDKKAAKRFFNKALGYSGKPDKITIDKSGSINAALKSINEELTKFDSLFLLKPGVYIDEKQLSDFDSLEVNYLKANAKKAKNLLNWSPKTSIEKLIEEMIEHELENS